MPSEQQGPYYQIEDGVSCEACHGPAEGWLGTHITRGYEAALKVGMYDTKNLLDRATKCLSCHVGDAAKSVDHAMIAAGHPDLIFELDTFTALLPPHWRQPDKPWLGAQAWSIGQAVALRAVMQRLALRAKQLAAPSWPEFAEFDCFACHHPIQNVPSTYYTRGQRGRLQAGKEWEASWRQVRGYAGVAGIPPWNASRYLVFRHLAAIAAPAAQQALDQELADLAQLMAKIGTADAKKITVAATRVAQQVEQLLPQVAGVTFNAQLVSKLLHHISKDGKRLAGGGVRVAEQTAMSLDALFLAYKKHVKGEQNADIQKAIDRLFEALDDPGQYDSQQMTMYIQTLHRFFPQP